MGFMRHRNLGIALVAAFAKRQGQRGSNLDLQGHGRTEGNHVRWFVTTS